MQRLNANVIREKWVTGKSTVELAKEYKCSVRTINRYLDNTRCYSLQWELMRPKNRSFDSSLALYMFEYGNKFYSLKEIAKACTLEGKPYSNESTKKKILKAKSIRDKENESK